MAAIEVVSEDEHDTETATLLNQSQFQVSDLASRLVRKNDPDNPPTLYADANFYIKSSRDYFKSRAYYAKYVPCYAWLYPFFFVASIFAYLNNIYATLLVVANLVFLIIYIQHLVIYITTMRYVLLQLDVPDDSGILNGNCNRHLEITYEQYKIRYSKTRNMEIGTISGEAGMIQLQILSQSTKKRLQRCVKFSTVYLIMSGLMVLYCFSWAIVLLLTCRFCGASHYVNSSSLELYSTFSGVIFANAELMLVLRLLIVNNYYTCI